MSSTSPRHGLSKTNFLTKGINTLRSLKTRLVVVFTLMLLTAVLSASALTASSSAGSLSSDNSQHAGFIASSTFDFLSLLGFNPISQPGKSGATALDTCADAPPDMVACFEAEQNANNSKGFNNGEWVGDSAYADGKVGTGAFSFSGNNHIEVADSLDLNPANITVDGWINLADSRSFLDVASKGDFAYALRVVGQKLQFTSRNAKGEAEILESGELIKANTWVHVAATHDGATRRIYINGYEVANDTQDGLQTTDTGVLRIGTGGIFAPTMGGDKSDRSDRSSARLADEVRLFGRALSAKEIKEIGDPNAPESASFQFTLTAQTVSESVGNVNITISRGTPAAAATVDLDFNVNPGTAVRGVGSSCSNPNPPGTDDYRSPTATGTQTLNFAPGEASKTIGIQICSDTVPEVQKAFVATLLNPTGADTINPAAATHTVTINDDDTTVGVTVSGPSSLEDTGPNLTYTWTRNDGTASNLVVNFVSSGTAGRSGIVCPGGDDFAALSATPGSWSSPSGPGNIQFAGNALTTTIVVDPCTDALVEPDETVIVTMAAGSYLIGANTVASATIINDDFSTIDWTTATVGPALGLDEGDPGATNSTTFTIVRTQPAGSVLSDLTVRFGLTGTATCAAGALQDYTVAGAQVTFDPTTCTGTLLITGANVNASFQVNTVADIRIEADETIIGTILPPQAPLTNANNYVVGGTIPTQTAFINDDDETITVDAVVIGSPILEAGPGGMTFHVNRIFGSSGSPAPAVTDALSVNFSLSALAPSGTQANCAGGADFTVSGPGVVYNPTLCTGTIAIAGSTVFADVLVTPVNDLVPESDETVTLTILPSTTGPAGNYGIGAAGANGVPSGTATATGTILNDDIQVIVTVSPASVLEDGIPNLIYTFTRIGDSASVITANFTASGSASPLNDYTVLGATTFITGNGQGTVAFPGGTNTTVGGVNSQNFLVTVDPTADTTVELDEEVQVTVNNGIGYTPGTPNLASGLIINDDTVVTVAVSPVSSNEDLGPNMVYTFTRTANFGVALNVPFTVSGTAIANDYTGTAPGAQTAVFAIGSPTTTVTVDPTADTTVEPDETVIFTLNAPAAGSGYTLGTPSVATGTIVNDDTDVNVTIAGSPIFENAAGVITYTFTRTGLINGNLTVNFSTTGTATSGTDYVQSSTGSVTITGPNTTATVTVDPTPDSDIEPDETVILTVLPGTGYNVGSVTPSQTGTITSDDVDVQINTAVANSPVLENGAPNLIYTIQRVAGSTTQEVTVPFTIGGGPNPATCGDDYDVLATAGVTFNNAGGCAGTGTAVIAAGNASTTVTVDPRPDLVVENDETVRVTLNSCAGSGASVGLVNTCDLVAATSVDGVITNDDTDVSVAISPASIIEDQPGVMTYTFTRNTSAALLALQFDVNYNSSGSACGIGACNDGFTQDFDVAVPAGSNYNGTNGTGTGATSNIRFAAGSSTAVITVDPRVDTNVEPDETVTLTVIAGTGYTPVANTFATGTIRDEDSSVQFSSATYSGIEGSGGGTTPFTLLVRRNGPGSATPAAAVDASTIQVGGTATGSLSCANAGTDYVVISGQTITWAAAEAGDKPFVITVCADNKDEADEILNSQLSNFIGTQTGSPLAAVTTILDDDAAPSFALTSTPTTVAEGSSATYTVTRSGNETQLSTTVVWTTTNGTATGGADFSGTTGSVIFAPGTGGTQTFTIAALTDALFEGPETFTVGLVNPASNGSPTSGTNLTTITDLNTAPTVSIGDVTQVEGCISPAVCGQSAFIFTITRTGDAQANQTMVASTQDGGGVTAATAPSDYVTVVGQPVTFTPGQTSVQVSVIVNGDTTFESDETFRVNLSTFNFGSATRGTGFGVITNDDSAPVFTINAGPVNVTEGNGGGCTNATYTITKTGATELQSIVSANTVNGTAVAPGDYDSIVNAQVAVFGPADVTKTFNVCVRADSVYEGATPETYAVNLFNATNGTLGAGISSIGTITDDEAAPNFAFVSVTPSVAEGGVIAARVDRTFPVGTTSTEVTSTVNCVASVTSANSTIHAQSNDFTSGTQLLSFGAATTTQPCNVQTTQDTVFEGTETFGMTATAGANVGVQTGFAGFTASILNDDACSFTVSNVTQNEGNSGSSNFVHTVTKACDTGGVTAFVNYAGTDGTAIAPVDYTAIIPGQLAFLPADTVKPLPVSVNGDLTIEPDETYNVCIVASAACTSAGLGATVNGVPVTTLTNGVGTIVNDDGIPITISGNIKQFVAGGPNTNLAGVTVNLTGTNTATTTTDASGNYTFTGLTSGGNFLITPTMAGKTLSPTTRSYSTLTTNVTNADFVAFNNGAVARNLRIINGGAVPGSATNPNVRINLTAPIGDAAALSFSLAYDPARLNTPVVTCGTTLPNCNLTVNTSVAGQIGISVEAFTAGGQPTTYPIGDDNVVNVSFSTTATTNASTPVTFTDVPSIRRTSDSSGNPLPTTYTNGVVVFQQGIEGDVGGPTTGDGFVLANDITVERNIIVGNTLVDNTTNQFQRADVSPAAIKGDGQIDSTDLTVLRNYVVNQNLQTAGGPFGPLFPIANGDGELNLPTFAGKANSPNVSGTRTISVVSNTASAGSVVFVNVALDSQGDEVGASFTVTFDTTRLSNPIITLGTDAPAGASLTTNVSQAATGRLGILVDAPANSPFAASPPLKKVVTIRFNVAANAVVGSTAAIGFSNTPTPQSVSNGNGDLLTTAYTAGTVTIIGPSAANVSISGRVTAPNGAGLRNASVVLTDSMGNRRTVTTSSFGFYQFDEVASGGQYILGVSSRTYRFTSRTITVNDNLVDQDFTGQE